MAREEIVEAIEIFSAEVRHAEEAAWWEELYRLQALIEARCASTPEAVEAALEEARFHEGEKHSLQAEASRAQHELDRYEEMLSEFDRETAQPEQLPGWIWDVDGSGLTGFVTNNSNRSY